MNNCWLLQGTLSLSSSRRCLPAVSLLRTMSSSSTASSLLSSAAQDFVNAFNTAYEAKHQLFEEQFWGTKMKLSSNSSKGGVVFSPEQLSATKKDMEDLLSDPETLKQAKQFRKQMMSSSSSSSSTASTSTLTLTRTLDCLIRTMSCYSMPDSAKTIREETSKLESQLEAARNNMTLGYTDPTTTTTTAMQDTFHAMSSVGLRNVIRTHTNEAVRQAAYQQGLAAIGPFVLEHGFVEIVKKRNQLAKQLGFEDYYDYKVTHAEGFNKKRLFEILDGLEQGTRPIMQAARHTFVETYGKDALLPWNMSFVMSGSVMKQMDPYFRFGKAVEQYIRSYAALGIQYEQSELNLDLLDRPGKYSNGFCHWIKPAWIKPDGTWQPAISNFTSLADPCAIGSGYTALTTLMHEAGHAAHFANVKQHTPLASQERAPTSVAYAETQSMFLDSLVSDAAWRAKYAKNAQGQVLPFEIIQQEIEATHPFAVFQLRAMLVVSYFEKALYELPDEQVTAETILQLATTMEDKIQGGPSPRPLLSVPHLVSDEASCYYHGYTLAEMCVHQTRAFFKERDGYIVDNPKVGPTLKAAYWECGNTRPFLELVQELTKSPLAGDSWVAMLNEPIADKIRREKQEYEQALSSTTNSTSTTTALSDDVDLNMTVRFVDGDTLIADSNQAGSILAACKQFEDFVAKRVAAGAASTTT